MAFKMKGFSGFMSSPMKNKIAQKEIKLQKPEDKELTKRQKRRAKVDAAEGNTRLEKRLSLVASKAKERKAKRSKKKVDRITSKIDKLNNKVEKINPAPKPKATTTVAKPKTTTTVTKPKVVKTKRGTGKTYKMAWESMSAKKKAGFKNYADFEAKAKAYNRAKDSQKASTGVMKSDINKKKIIGPQNKK
jgi:hypothetical protein